MIATFVTFVTHPKKKLGRPFGRHFWVNFERKMASIAWGME